MKKSTTTRARSEPRDEGSDYARLRRLERLGRAYDPATADAYSADCAIDVLRSHGHLTDDQCSALATFGALLRATSAIQPGIAPQALERIQGGAGQLAQAVNNATDEEKAEICKAVIAEMGGVQSPAFRLARKIAWANEVPSQRDLAHTARATGAIIVTLRRYGGR